MPWSRFTRSSSVGAAEITDGSITTADIGNSQITAAKLAAGVPVQVVQTVKTDTFTTSSSGGVDVTGMSVSITPTASTSKVLVFADVMVGAASTAQAYFRLARGATETIYVGDLASSRIQASAQINGNATFQYDVIRVPIMVLDSPATTSATSYKLVGWSKAGTAAIYVNRSAIDSDNNGYVRGPSSITAIEVRA